MTNKISIIIPTYNEANAIGKLVAYLQKHSCNLVSEIIVSDGGSTDETVAIAAKLGAVTFTALQKGRAAQMNFAASKASGTILYFVHADCLPPITFAKDIITAIENGYDFGRYCSKFDSISLLLKINAWFTRFNWFICYGGDQTLFVNKTIFVASGGFKKELLIMEEYEFCERLMKEFKYKIFSSKTLISARKYEGKRWLKVQLANRKAMQSFRKGLPQQKIIEQYKKMLA